MKCLEYVAKELFRRHGIPTPSGIVVTTPEQIDSTAVPGPVALKAQVLIGGRGKAGGIQFASSVPEARQKAAAILAMKIRGFPVHSLLIEPKLDIARELYLSILIDRAARLPVILASAAGGIEIESVPEEQLFRRTIDPLIGLQPYITRELNAKLGLTGETATQVATIVQQAYEVFVQEDAELVEINPLVITTQGKVLAGDGKLVIDNDALFRHKDLPEQKADEFTDLEAEARAKGIAFIQLEGDIGVIANGAGLTMATLDALTLVGGAPGIFLDLGGTDDPRQVTGAFELMLKAHPKVIFLNIFGGITKCDTVASGVVAALKGIAAPPPVIVRIKGLNEVQAKGILADAGLTSVDYLEEGAQRAVDLHPGTARGA